MVSGLMRDETERRAMPPWGAFETDECKPNHTFRDDLRLTEAEVALFAAWYDAGSPEGDPAAAPPPIELKGIDLPGMTLEVQPAKPFVSSGDADQFRCFVMDPGLEKDSYLNGWNFIAGNPKVVHHALLFVDPRPVPATPSPTRLAVTSASAAPASAAISSRRGLRAASPSSSPPTSPRASPRAPSSSCRSTTTLRARPTIRTPPASRCASPSSPEYEMVFALIGNDGNQQANGDGLQSGPNDDGDIEFRIPAEASDHTETMLFTLPETINGGPMPELYVYGSGTHMHYVGTDMRVKIDHKNAASAKKGDECLVQTPDWNFAWQRAYLYDTKVEDLPRFLPGDVLEMRCKYDNTMKNPYVVKALKDQKLQAPVDVFLGESTLDEMCLAVLPLLYKAQ